MPPRRRDTPDAKIKIGGNSYYLETRGGEPVYSTGTRVIEGQQDDRWEEVIEDYSEGLGGGALAAGTRVTCSERNRLFIAPSIADSINTATVDTPFRYSFEAQDASGNWYKYFVSRNQIAKVDISTASGNPTLCRVYDVGTTANFNANDMLAAPIKLYNGSVTRWYFPTNNGDRIVYMADPVATDLLGGGSADTFAAVSPVVSEGAAFFRQLPSGDVLRINSTHDGGTFQNRCEISLLDAGTNPETDANWSADTPIANQTDWALALMNFEETAVVRKSDDKWYTATRLQDGSFQFRDILPDQVSAQRFAIGSEVNHEGVVWHGRLYLPTSRQLWRHNLSSAFPVGLESIHDDVWEGDIPSSDSGRGAVVGGLAPGGEWLWAQMYLTGGDEYWVMAAREPRAGDNTPQELIWVPVWYRASSVTPPYTQMVSLQENGHNAPALWFTNPVGTGDYDLVQIQVGPSGSPFAPSGNYGTPNVDGSAYTRNYLFPCTVQLTEVRLLIESSSANLVWRVYASFEGGTYNEVQSGGRATSGSLFPDTPGTNDNGRRLRLRIDQEVGAIFAPTSTPPTLRELRFSGYYLPDVGDPVQCVINVAKTAARRKVSQASVRAELKGFRSSIQAFVDIHDTSGYLKVTDANQTAPEILAGRDAGELMTLNGEVVEYS